MVLTIFVFLLILLLLVLVHELGHFIVAKRLGIKVEEFGFGFPPRIWSKKRGETIYSINALPLGGFVKLYGEDEVGAGRIKLRSVKSANEARDSDLGRAFFARPAWQRASVILAGVVMNVVLAFVIYYFFLALSQFKTDLPLFGEHTFFLVNQAKKTEVIVASVAKNSPAEQSGILPYSKVLKLNDQAVVGLEQFIDQINKNKGKGMSMTLQEIVNNRIYSVRTIPRVAPPKNEGALGVSLSTFDTVQLSYDTFSQKALSGVIHPSNLFVYNIKIIGKLIGISYKERTVAPIGEGVSGPLGIFVLVGNILELPELKERILQILNLAGLISISLAFFNVLPIPALDGGRLFFILIEVVTRKKISPKVESFAHAFVFALLLILIVLVTLKDIPLFLQFISKGLHP